MIKVKNVYKTYNVPIPRDGIIGGVKDIFNPKSKKINAVSDLSFRIDKGEIVGYLGLNGAGKSTTIKMLTGIIETTSGDIKVNNLTPRKNRYNYAKSIGVMFGQKSQLYWDLAVSESYELLRNMYSVTEEEYLSRMKLINELLELEDLMSKPVRKLSLGQRTLCELAAVFIHNPAVVFLDEPTIGLDIFIKEKVRLFIKEINARYKTTFVITTHDIDDIEQLCNRVMVIDEGRLIYNGSINDVYSKYGELCELTFEGYKDFNEFMPKAKELENLKWTIDGNMLKTIHNKLDISSVEIIEKVLSLSSNIKDVSMTRASLEFLIKKIYGR